VGISVRDRHRLLHSIARWLSGLRPAMGRQHYFERFAFAGCVKKRLDRFRGKRICPFCGKTFKKFSAFVTHVMRCHCHEIEDLLEKCECSEEKEKKG